jgi:glycosyltransferase involved in cell wall biosynthesis
MTDKLPRVSIGLPTYNRPELLALALEAFRKQTFADFELIISDNASPDLGVREVCERYASLDPRFRYVRQPVNQGAERNFWYVYDQARAPLFLWASDDDLWPQEFLERGVAALDANMGASGWFCQVVNINLNGDIIRTYPSFGRFQSGALRFIDLARFLWEPEIMGKANLIFSIFRRQALRHAVEMFRDRPSSWGSDMNLVYGYLCRFNLMIDDRLILRKRVPVETLDKVLVPRLQIYPRSERAVYFQNYRRVAAGSGYLILTTVILAVRSAYDYWYSGRARSDFDDWPLRCRFEDSRKRSVARLIRVLGRILKRVCDF